MKNMNCPFLPLLYKSRLSNVVYLQQTINRRTNKFLIFNSWDLIRENLFVHRRGVEQNFSKKWVGRSEIQCFFYEPLEGEISRSPCLLCLSSLTLPCPNISTSPNTRTSLNCLSSDLPWIFDLRTPTRHPIFDECPRISPSFAPWKWSDCQIW